MEIPFRIQSDSREYAFFITFEHEQITASFDGDISRLNIPVRFKRTPFVNNQQQDLYPVVLELHGRLFRVNAPNDWGATLLPLEDMPISLISAKSEHFVNLSFAFSRLYLQQLEEQRASQPGQNILLAMRMSGVAAIMGPRKDPPKAPDRAASQGLPPRPVQPGIEVIRFENIHTDYNSFQTIRIARSDWIDTLLPNLGYRRSVLIELPLMRTPPVSEIYQKATEALDKARNAFNHEDYRDAVKYGREVLEHLGKSSSDGSGKLTSFCKEHLEPFVGETKSNAVERSLNALREVINASSHIDPQKPFIVDRAIAAYVVETLALNLRYISSFLG
jgi:hypothetical protein